MCGAMEAKGRGFKEEKIVISLNVVAKSPKRKTRKYTLDLVTWASLVVRGKQFWS